MMINAIKDWIKQTFCKHQLKKITDEFRTEIKQPSIVIDCYAYLQRKKICADCGKSFWIDATEKDEKYFDEYV